MQSSIWIKLILQLVLFSLVLLYDYKYEALLDYMDIHLQARHRILIRTVVGIIAVVADAVGIWLTKGVTKDQWIKRVVLYTLICMIVLHIINSLVALLKLKKIYVAIDIITFLIRFIGCWAIAAIQFFVLNDVFILITCAALYLQCRRAVRMLDGGWLEQRLDDFDFLWQKD